MATRGMTLRIDNVTYVAFPTAEELLELRNNMIRSFIDFLHTVGVNGRAEIARILGSAPEEIDRLCARCRINPEVSQGSISNAAEYHRVMQRNVLGGLKQQFRVNVREVIEQARKRSELCSLNAIVREVYQYLTNLLKRSTSDRKLPRGVIDKAKVDEIVRNCPIAPIYSWEEASKDVEYVRELLTVAFPHVPLSVVARYLFTDDAPCVHTISDYCRFRYIGRCTVPNEMPVYFEEQVAFACWSGHEPKTFIAAQAEKDNRWRRYL